MDLQIVKIKLIDMSYNTSTRDVNHLNDFGLVKIELCGFLVEERPDCIIVAKEYQAEESQWRHLTAIPKVCILSMVKYEPTSQ
jgi:hypothetical protein